MGCFLGHCDWVDFVFVFLNVNWMYIGRFEAQDVQFVNPEKWSKIESLYIALILLNFLILEVFT